MDLSVYEAVKAIITALENGYNPELVINGQYYEIKKNNNYDLIFYEVIKAKQD